MAGAGFERVSDSSGNSGISILKSTDNAQSSARTSGGTSGLSSDDPRLTAILSRWPGLPLPVWLALSEAFRDELYRLAGEADPATDPGAATVYRASSTNHATYSNQGTSR